MKVANVIRSLISEDNYIIVVEHDLAVLDYLSDFVCVLYGEPAAYGVVTMPFGVRDGINVFLAGFVPTENMRFREVSITFKMAETAEFMEQVQRTASYQYPTLKKTLGKFSLTIEQGDFSDSEIIVMLGQNGTGKTTFIKILAGKLAPDDNIELPKLQISYKPQTISPQFEGTVRTLLHQRIPQSYQNPAFVSEVSRPLKLDLVIDNEVKKCSGGELQCLGLIVSLGKSADLYLIDEPSAYLDSEQRIVAAKVIKRHILNS